jgi:hypothetical protein
VFPEPIEALSCAMAGSKIRRGVSEGAGRKEVLMEEVPDVE